jgi:hypothetical protein
VSTHHNKTHNIGILTAIAWRDLLLDGHKYGVRFFSRCWNSLHEGL